MLQAPNEVACYLEQKHAQRTGTGTLARESAPVAAPAAVAPPREDGIYRSISRSYHRQRLGMAALAIAFPVLLWIGSDPPALLTSLSAYYHHDFAGSRVYGAGDSRNIFVGVLWAIGAFLFLYKGYSKAENIALNVAGLCAILVSLFPTDWPPNEAESIIGKVHYGSAILFFLMIASVCLFLSGKTPGQANDTGRDRLFARLYALFGALMIVLPGAVLVLHLLDTDRTNSRAILWVEIVGIYVFASFWITKTIEIRLLEREAGLVH